MDADRRLDSLMATCFERLGFLGRQAFVCTQEKLYDMTIPLNVEGRIVNAAREGHFVRVEDDRVNTGGFLIYEWWSGSDGPNDKGAFDSWVESKETLSRFFAESEWTVQWLAQ